MQVVLTPYSFACDRFVQDRRFEKATVVFVPYRVIEEEHHGQRIRWSCSLGRECGNRLCRYSRPPTGEQER